jgi:uncharacterized protein YpbB
MFRHCNFHKLIWTFDEKKNNKIYCILIGKRQHSSVPDVHSFWGADCDTDYYLVVAKDRVRLAVSEQCTDFISQKFNLKKLNKTEGKEKYQVETSNRFTALETTYYTEYKNFHQRESRLL